MDGIKVELKDEQAITVERRNGKRRILASPNKIVRPTQVLIHLVLSITGFIGIATANFLLAVPMLLLLSPLNVVIIGDEFYRSTMKFNDGFELGVGRNIYYGYADFLFEIFHPALRYNVYNG